MTSLLENLFVVEVQLQEAIHLLCQLPVQTSGEKVFLRKVRLIPDTFVELRRKAYQRQVTTSLILIHL